MWLGYDPEKIEKLFEKEEILDSSIFSFIYKFSKPFFGNVGRKSGFLWEKKPIFFWSRILTLYQTTLTFNNPYKEAFWQDCG